MRKAYCDRCKEYVTDVDRLGFNLRSSERKICEFTINGQDFDLCQCCLDAEVRALRDSGLQVKDQ